MRGAYPLDQVVWNALASKQSRFTFGNDRAIQFPAAIAPFAAMADFGQASFEALPFLHVLTSNRAAIALYRTLGFVERREMHLAVRDENVNASSRPWRAISVRVALPGPKGA
jgi:hypothetical protein